MANSRCIMSSKVIATGPLGGIEIGDGAGLRLRVVGRAQILLQIVAVIDDALVAMHPQIDHLGQVLVELRERGLDARVARRRGIGLPLLVVRAVDVVGQPRGMRRG